MTRLQLKMMMEGLIATAVEWILVLGWEEARGEVQRLTKLVHDLDNFWNPDFELSNIDWAAEMAAILEKVKEL